MANENTIDKKPTQTENVNTADNIEQFTIANISTPIVGESEITINLDKRVLLQVVDYALMRLAEMKANELPSDKTIEIINNINIEGDVDAEDVAQRLTRQLKIDMRAL